MSQSTEVSNARATQGGQKEVKGFRVLEAACCEAKPRHGTAGLANPPGTHRAALAPLWCLSQGSSEGRPETVWHM